jgi:hypothetical protein
MKYLDRTGGHAGRKKPLLYPVDTERAFLHHSDIMPATGDQKSVCSVKLLMIRILVGHISISCKVTHTARPVNIIAFTFIPGEILAIGRFLPSKGVDTVWTGNLTISAADTGIEVRQDKAVFTLEPGSYRTYLCAWSIIAMLARSGLKHCLHIRVGPFLPPKYIHIESVLAGIIFNLAGFHAGFAPHTS